MYIRRNIKIFKQAGTLAAFGILFISIYFWCGKHNAKSCLSGLDQNSGLAENAPTKNFSIVLDTEGTQGQSAGNVLCRKEPVRIFTTKILEPWAIESRRDVIVTYVQSSAVNGYRRYLIRKTWGDRLISHGEYRIQVMFVIGRYTLHVKHPQSVLDLHEENRQYGDILYVPDVLDTYDNLTLKEIQGKRWISEHAQKARYVLKVDDDVFINTRAWIIEVEKLDSGFYARRCPKRTCIICKIWTGQIPFCSGSGYLMTKETLDALVKAVDSAPLFKRDDRFFTGFVRSKTEVKLIDRTKRFHFLHSKFDHRGGPETLDFLMIHNYTLDRWESMWYDIIQSR